MSNPHGRPRTHDRLDIAEKMVTWALLDDSINLCGFCATVIIAPSKITDWSKECSQFREAYEAVKGIIAWRREKLLTEGKLHVKAYDLNAKTYDHFMKMESRDELKYVSDLKKEEDKNVSSSVEQSYTNIMGQLSSLQDTLKTDCIKNNIAK